MSLLFDQTDKGVRLGTLDPLFVYCMCVRIKECV